jgi:phage baseplate assembly protein W
MQPTYGTNLINVLFEPNNEELKEDIQDLLKTAINYWLPYINI